MSKRRNLIDDDTLNDLQDEKSFVKIYVSEPEKADRETLALPLDTAIDLTLIKRHYRKLALKLHPDKLPAMMNLVKRFEEEITQTEEKYKGIEAVKGSALKDKLAAIHERKKVETEKISAPFKKCQAAYERLLRQYSAKNPQTADDSKNRNSETAFARDLFNDLNINENKFHGRTPPPQDADIKKVGEAIRSPHIVESYNLIFDLLEQKKIKADGRLSKDTRFLEYAVRMKRLDLCILFIHYGANPNTALHAAIETADEGSEGNFTSASAFEQLKCLMPVLNAKINFNTLPTLVQKIANTPVDNKKALNNLVLDLASFEVGSSIISQLTPRKKTELEIRYNNLFTSKSFSILKFLLSQPGVDLHFKDLVGNTPLMKAVFHKKYVYATLLRSYGARLRERNFIGDTIKSYMDEQAREALESGADERKILLLKMWKKFSTDPSEETALLLADGIMEEDSDEDAGLESDDQSDHPRSQVSESARMDIDDKTNVNTSDEKLPVNSSPPDVPDLKQSIKDRELVIIKNDSHCAYYCIAVGVMDNIAQGKLVLDEKKQDSFFRIFAQNVLRTPDKYSIVLLTVKDSKAVSPAQEEVIDADDEALFHRNLSLVPPIFQANPVLVKCGDRIFLYHQSFTSPETDIDAMTTYGIEMDSELLEKYLTFPPQGLMRIATTQNISQEIYNYVQTKLKYNTSYRENSNFQELSDWISKKNRQELFEFSTYNEWGPVIRLLTSALVSEQWPSLVAHMITEIMKIIHQARGNDGRIDIDTLIMLYSTSDLLNSGQFGRNLKGVINANSHPPGREIWQQEIKAALLSETTRKLYMDDINNGNLWASKNIELPLLASYFKVKLYVDNELVSPPDLDSAAEIHLQMPGGTHYNYWRQPALPQPQPGKNPKEEKYSEIISEIKPPAKKELKPVNYDLLFEMINKAIEQNPLKSSHFHNLGQLLFIMKKYPQAVDAYDQALKLNSAVLKRFDGYVFLKGEYYPQALLIFKSQLRNHPDNPEFHRGMALAFIGLGNPVRALATINEAIRLNPLNAEYYSDRSNVYMSALYDKVSPNEECQQALSDINKAIELNPREATFYANRSILRCFYHQEGLAIDDLIAANMLDPGNGDYFNMKASLLFQKGRYTEALKAFDQAIACDPENDHYYSGKGEVLLQMTGHNHQALEIYNHAILLNPKNDDYYNIRASIYSCFGEYKQALADAEKAIELNPDCDQHHGLKGLILSCMGRYEEAKPIYKTIVDINYKKAVAATTPDIGIIRFDSELNKPYEKLLKDIEIASRGEYKSFYKGDYPPGYVKDQRFPADYDMYFDSTPSVFSAFKKPQESFVLESCLHQKKLEKEPLPESSLQKSEKLTSTPEEKTIFISKDTLKEIEKTALDENRYLLDKSLALMMLQEYQEARALIEDAVEFSPEDPQLQLAKAIAHSLTSGLNPNVVYMFSQVSELAEDDFFYVIKAYLLSTSLQMKKREEMLSYRINMVNMLIAILYGDKTRALLMLHSAICPVPYNRAAFENPLHHPGQTNKKADLLYRKAIALNPRENLYFYFRAKMCYDFREYGLAKNYYRQAIAGALYASTQQIIFNQEILELYLKDYHNPEIARYLLEQYGHSLLTFEVALAQDPGYRSAMPDTVDEILCSSQELEAANLGCTQHFGSRIPKARFMPEADSLVSDEKHGHGIKPAPFSEEFFSTAPASSSGAISSDSTLPKSGTTLFSLSSSSSSQPLKGILRSTGSSSDQKNPAPAKSLSQKKVRFDFGSSSSSSSSSSTTSLSQRQVRFDYGSKAPPSQPTSNKLKRPLEKTSEKKSPKNVELSKK